MLNGAPQGASSNGNGGNDTFDPLLNDGGDPAKKPLFDPFYEGANGDAPDGFNDFLAFIEPSDLQDLDGNLDGNDNAEDPGWVILGKDDSNGGGFQYEKTGVDLVDDIGAEQGSLGGIDIEKLVDITFSCSPNDSGNFDDVVILTENSSCTSGWWSIMPD